MQIPRTSSVPSASRAVASRFVAAIVALTAAAAGINPAAAADLPAIKWSPTNAVPACATPGRLQAFLKARNPNLDTRFDQIATDYMRHGEALGLRWDYAFFQMIMETGQLSFRNGNRSGDVKPQQNNFAGLGATGGVPGESFPDVATGVRAHLEHVLLYAGEAVAAPVAERTRKVHQWGVLTTWQKSISHPITYAELASQWAPKSKAYVDGLAQIAGKFFDDTCNKPDPQPELAAAARGQAERPGQTGQTATKLAAAPVAAPVIEPAPEKISGADLARKAIIEGDTARYGLGAGLAPAIKILNAPSTDPAINNDAPAAPATTPHAPAATAVVPPVAKTQRAIGGTTRPATTKTAAAGAAAKPIVPLPEVAPPVPEPTLPAQTLTAPTITDTPAPVGAAKCRVWTASYGGQRAVIVKSVIDQIANFTVLDVNEGQESREAEAFISAYAKGGSVAGEFTNQDRALEKAFELCPEG